MVIDFNPQPYIEPESLRLISTLGKAMDARAARIRVYDDYYNGKQRLAFATSKFRATFGYLFSAFSDNFCALVVDAVEERLDVESFRIGSVAADKAAWAIWQRNQLDAYSQIAHKEALVKEMAYALVWSDPEAPGEAQVTIEDPLTTIVAYEAGSYRRRAAGLKRWLDEDGYVCATLYLPDRIEKYTSARKLTSVAEMSDLSNTTWVQRYYPDEAWPLHNPLGVVPLVPLVNRPRLDGSGQSEIHGVISIQDAINKLVADMVVASEFSAFRQRWATGIDIPNDESTGEPVENLKAAVDRMWASGNEEAKFGEFEAADLAPFVKGVEMLIQHIASTTRTPYHYFLQHGGQPPSGESLRASETGLVAKAVRKQRHFGEAWEEVIRLAFKVEGDDAKAEVEDSETKWADPESKSESEHVDALVKLKTISVPDEQLWEDAGYTPTQTRRFKAMRERQQATAIASATAMAEALPTPAPAAPTTKPAAKPPVGDGGMPTRLPTKG